MHFYITWVIYKQFSRRVKANCFPCYNLKIWGLGAKLCEAFLLFLFWKELRYFKVKESMVFVEQNINFIKKETLAQVFSCEFCEISMNTFFYRTPLVAASVLHPIWESQIKSKTVISSRKKKRAFYVPLILSEGNFFKICVLSQCIAYWIQFQNIYTFTYQKTLLHTLLLLVSKIVESL